MTLLNNITLQFYDNRPETQAIKISAVLIFHVPGTSEAKRNKKEYLV